MEDAQARLTDATERLKTAEASLESANRVFRAITNHRPVPKPSLSLCLSLSLSLSLSLCLSLSLSLSLVQA